MYLDENKNYYNVTEVLKMLNKHLGYEVTDKKKITRGILDSWRSRIIALKKTDRRKISDKHVNLLLDLSSIIYIEKIPFKEAVIHYYKRKKIAKLISVLNPKLKKVLDEKLIKEVHELFEEILRIETTTHGRFSRKSRRALVSDFKRRV
jgi:hypothetical protein